MKKILAVILGLVLLFGMVGASCTGTPDSPSTEYRDQIESVIEDTSSKEEVSDEDSESSSEIPQYSGKAYIAINNNIPSFSEGELTTTGYENYSSLDKLGRVGVAIASCGKEIMPKADEERGSISSVNPTGWVQAKYEGISGGWLWNRCHLIGWQLSAENANEKNLITGTRYMNIEGMLVFENMVADYIKETGNHVAYRITPVFEGNNLVCSGVQMEGYSIEDDGEGICFNVYCYNVQPGIYIDYATGKSSESKDDIASAPSDLQEDSSIPATESEAEPVPSEDMVWIPTNGGTKYHSKSSCSKMIDPRYVTKSEAQNLGFGPCGRCY